MPLLLIIVGAVLLVTAIRGTTGSLATHLAQDFSGQFLVWLLAIVLIGAIGYAPPLKQISRLLLALVAVVIVLKDGSGFISQFVQQLESAPAPTAPAPAGGNAQLPDIPVKDSGSSSSSGGSSDSGSGGISASNVLDAASLAAMFA